MEQRLEWFGTLRARLGATPTPDSLIYATGGLAVGRIKTSGSVSGSSLGLTDGVTQGVAIDVDADGNPIEVPVDVPIVIASADPTSTTFFSQKTKAGLDGWRRRGGSSRRQLDRQGRVPLPGFWQRLDHRGPADEFDPTRHHLQFPRHGKSRARRPQLQIRSERSALRCTSGRKWAHGVQGADPLGVDLGRLLCRRHHRLRLGQIQHGHGVQRSRQRGPAVCHQRVPQARGRHRRCARRLQLGCRQYPGRRGSGSQLCRPARANASQLPRRSLQSGACRNCRRPVGAGDLRARPEIGVVRDVARATGCNGYPRCSCLCHRRSRGRARS